MSSPHSSLNYEDTFGALLIGALFTMTIYGITTLQAYFYFLSFPKDGVRTKQLVALIWMLDSVHAIFMCHAVHFYLIEGFTNPSLLANGNWSLFGSVAMNVILAFIVQGFFTQRIYILCEGRKRYWITGVISVFVFAHFIFGIATVIHLFKKKQFIYLKDLSLNSVVPFGVTTIISDILIASALCALLASNRSTFADTNSVINKLIIYAVNRCILTCAAAIAETIVFSVVPNSFYTIAIDFVIGKLYANSLLAVLNARADLGRQAREAQSSTELSTSFNVTPALVNHQTSMIRTRQSARGINDDDEVHIDDGLLGDFEKGPVGRDVGITSTSSSYRP